MVLLVLTGFAPLAAAQGSATPTTPEIVEDSSPEIEIEGFVISHSENGTECRDATHAEALRFQRRESNLRLRPISLLPVLDGDGVSAHDDTTGAAGDADTSANASGGSSDTATSSQAVVAPGTQSAGLRIMLNGTAQLAAMPEAEAAFRRAAAVWEGIISTPITINIDVDFGTSHFGESWGTDSTTLGQTSSPLFLVRDGSSLTYPRLRQALIDTASSAQERAIYERLPIGLVPTNVVPTSEMSIVAPVLQALGMISNTSITAANFPKIAFNSNYSFDFNPDDGIETGKTDFVAVAAHEIGHALGFSSRSGAQELDPTRPLRLSIWDLFRFQPGTTLDTFSVAPRTMTAGGTHIYFAGNSELLLSTGRPDGTGGDSRQASHWKDDGQNGGVYIGIMDPTIPRARRYQLTQNDVDTVNMFGYRVASIAAPPPPPPAEYQPATLSTNQVELRTWQTGGRTEAYVKMTFPTGGYRVTSTSQATRSGNEFTGEALVERFNGAATQALTSSALIFNLGDLAPGTYTFVFRTSGAEAKRLNFTVSAQQSANVIDNATAFVQSHYRDFLSREPDAPGLNFWTSQITSCGADAACIDRKRVSVSASFFLSQEFQGTGYYVYRVYRGALGRRPRHNEFLTGAGQVAAGIVVNNNLSPTVIDANKLAFAAALTGTSEFRARYPDSMTSEQYVNRLFETTGINASAADRAALANNLNAGAETRATVLFKIVDGTRSVQSGNTVNPVFETSYGRAFYDKEYSPAFVQMQYFGYLKRDEDDGGYGFWLNKLNSFGGNFEAAEMVRSFILAPEYRARFGQP